LRYDPKRRGEVSELAFALKAASLGIAVAKPYGDSEAYDFIVDTGARLLRVQVKSTSSPGRHKYNIGLQHFWGKGCLAYTAKEIDFVVAHIVPRDLWYVLPVRSFVGRRQLRVYPDGCRSGGRFEKYREAWHLLA
jgi:hypothetical protein